VVSWQGEGGEGEGEGEGIEAGEGEGEGEGVDDNEGAPIPVRDQLPETLLVEPYLLTDDDGRVAIDNNAAERAIKPVVIGRKNFLFAGSDAGGETLASAMTIIETAKFNGLDPQACLTDIFARIYDHKINRLDELLPWNCKPVADQPAAA